MSTKNPNSSEFVTPQHLKDADLLRKREQKRGVEEEVLADLGMSPPIENDLGSVALGISDSTILERGRERQQRRGEAHGHLAGVPNHVIENRLPPKPINQSAESRERSRTAMQLSREIFAFAGTQDQFFKQNPDKRELAESLGWFSDSSDS